jgi:hypothetical protein
VRTNRAKAFETALRALEMDLGVKLPRHLPCRRGRQSIVYKRLHDCTVIEILEAPNLLEKIMSQRQRELSHVRTLIALFNPLASSTPLH